ncbi:hypothetical protein J5N97_014129 [Dioscorea zingiberensis]|uniref:Fe2OG dioxygenase domain-containing protein n=1 Tax=Dioscorea zingiberensis TaxID=325984 RepID=A0A9D5CUN0_9LILI|nr:hypothetical protein J5N97_014129 [Dioscorea zingiberensis]
MVAASVMALHSSERSLIRSASINVPVIDLSMRRELKAELIIKACEEFGFFQVINHGVPDKVVSRMELAGMEFFSLPSSEKLLAGPANPLGYGTKSIGSNGDTGDLEYLLLHSNPISISQRARSVCRTNPIDFSYVVNEYVGEVRELAYSITTLRATAPSQATSMTAVLLEPIAAGLDLEPQILTILRSNSVAGLQIRSPSPAGASWIPVPPNPDAFCVNVGDVLQVMTNGRPVSVRHRVMANSNGTRMSTAFFGAPPLHAWISPLPETITPLRPCCYKSFTWSEFKKVMYSLSLGHDRLDLFRLDIDDDDDDDDDDEGSGSKTCLFE